MLHQYEKDSLYYQEIANAAHQMEKYATEVSNLYKDDHVSNEKLQLRKACLIGWFNELNNLLQSM
jgi:hypothetical protein